MCVFSYCKAHVVKRLRFVTAFQRLFIYHDKKIQVHGLCHTGPTSVMVDFQLESAIININFCSIIVYGY